MTDIESIDSRKGGLSPTTSVARSLASLKTEEHNELYDHRQQEDFMQHTRGSHSLEIRRIHSKDEEHARSITGSIPGMNTKTNHLQVPGAMRSVGSDSGSHNSADESDNEIDIGMPGNISAAAAKSSRPRGSATHSATYFSKTAQDNAQPLPRRGSHSLAIPLMKKKSRSSSNASQKGNLLSRTLSIKSQSSQSRDLRRRVTRNASIDSDDSQASHLSQETEKDVCFPIQKREHTRINGVDFDELDEFVGQERDFINSNLFTQPSDILKNPSKIDINKAQSSSDSTTSASSAALKYIPKFSSAKNGISFGNNKVEPDEYDEDDMKKYNNGYPQESPYPIENEHYVVPDRFSYFSSDVADTVHSPDLSSLVEPNQSFRELFKDGSPTWWLDCSCPTDEEMRCLTKAFGIHPLTAEDIRMQETREKVELFKNYYFICFHTFENDCESEDFLEPINVYIVVFANGILTFHFNPISHCANVRRRVRQLRDYVGVNSDWICYALVDDITDSFAPVIQSIEYEADAIEDSVFMARDMDFAAMLHKIGESRRKTMTLMRLLSGKADVIKMFAKRCRDDINGIGPALTSQVNIANLQFKMPPDSGPTDEKRQQPRADIAMYLGDIQDHIVTMFQNLLSYEKIFSRSHANYLAQLQVESFNTNNKVTEMLGKVTMIGTMLVPLNVITGLFGMNVRVPGQPNGEGGFGWFFGVLGVLVAFAIGSLMFSSVWLSRINTPKTLNEASVSGTKSIINFRPRSLKNGQYNLPNKSNKSVLSFSTSKMGRYE